MPTYEYQCPAGHVLEQFQKMTDRPRARCPVCGKPATRKISGWAGLVFKGSGFYITDYGKDGKGPRKAESDKPAAESTPKADKTDKADKVDKAEKPDTKPSPRAEDKPSKSAPSRRAGKAPSE